jgi:hypothetical protein
MLVSFMQRGAYRFQSFDMLLHSGGRVPLMLLLFRILDARHGLASSIMLTTLRQHCTSRLQQTSQTCNMRADVQTAVGHASWSAAFTHVYVYRLSNANASHFVHCR